MPTSTADEAYIVARLSTLSDLLDYLDTVNPVSHEELARDDTKRYALERVLTKAVEVSSDICANILASGFNKTVSTRASSVKELANVGIIDEVLSARLQDALKLRNILKHQDLYVDYELIVRASTQAQADFSEFRTAVARWLKENQHS